MLGNILFILYTREMFQLVEKRLYAYADDFTLLAVVRKPADRPAVAVSLKQGLSWDSGVVQSPLQDTEF